jgi:hypothetical protein
MKIKFSLEIIYFSFFLYKIYLNKINILLLFISLLSKIKKFLRIIFNKIKILNIIENVKISILNILILIKLFKL